MEQDLPKNQEIKEHILTSIVIASTAKGFQSTNILQELIHAYSNQDEPLVSQFQ